MSNTREFDRITHFICRIYNNINIHKITLQDIAKSSKYLNHTYQVQMIHVLGLLVAIQFRNCYFHFQIL